MDKIRINDLARELEVKSKAIIDYLPTIGIDDKKSHSSSLDADLVERVRKHFQGESDKAASTEKARSRAAAPDEIKTKIDLSKISSTDFLLLFGSGRSVLATFLTQLLLAQISPKLFISKTAAQTGSASFRKADCRNTSFREIC